MLNGSWSCECGQPTCRHRVSKHPRVSAWRARATKDGTQIAKWAKQWPLANWAIVTGVDIDVIDLDAKPSKPSGIVQLQCWSDNDAVSTPDSIRMLTSGGGMHIYFRTGDGLACLLPAHMTYPPVDLTPPSPPGCSTATPRPIPLAPDPPRQRPASHPDEQHPIGTTLPGTDHC